MERRIEPDDEILGAPVVSAQPSATASSGRAHDRQFQAGTVDPAVELEHLRRLLATLPVIEQSKGILMTTYGIDAGAAFNLLRRWSQTNNVKLVRVSEALVAAATDPAGLTRLLKLRPFDRPVEPTRPGSL